MSKDIVAAALTAAGIGLELSDDESEDASVAASQHPAPDEIIISDVEPETARTTLTQPSVIVTEAPDPTAKMPTKPTKVLTKPRPVSETDHPCQRRQNDKVQSPGAVARSKTVQDLKRQGAETALPPTSAVRAASNKQGEGENSRKRSHRPTPSSLQWPKRYHFPPVADILEYRGDLGSDATPEDIASMAASYFGW